MKESYGIGKEEIEQGKAMAGLSYLGLAGFLIAFVTSRDNRYVAYHAQQGLALAICWMGVLLLWPLTAIPILGWIFLVAWLLIDIPLIVLFIIGLINGFTGNLKPLPVIGGLGFKIGIFDADETIEAEQAKAVNN